MLSAESFSLGHAAPRCFLFISKLASIRLVTPLEGKKYSARVMISNWPRYPFPRWETFCSSKFNRKLAVKRAYPRVSKESRRKKIMPRLARCWPSRTVSSLPRLAFRPWNLRVLILTVHLCYLDYVARFYPPFLPVWTSPTLFLDSVCSLPFPDFGLALRHRPARKFIGDFNRAFPFRLRELEIVGCYFHFVDHKRTPPRCLAHYFLYIYSCHWLDPLNRSPNPLRLSVCSSMIDLYPVPEEPSCPRFDNWRGNFRRVTGVL